MVDATWHAVSALSFTFMLEAILASDVMLSSNLGGEWRLSTHPDSIDSTQSPLSALQRQP